MPIFKALEDRYLNTNHVSDISYTPTIRLQPDSREPPAGETVPAASLSSTLKITLETTEIIHIVGDEADAAWEAFRDALRSPKRSDSPRGSGGSS